MAYEPIDTSDTMSGQQRLLAALRCEPTDRVPIEIRVGPQPYDPDHWATKDPRYAELTWYTKQYTDIVYRWSPPGHVAFNANVEVIAEEVENVPDEYRIVKSTIPTPMGDLVELVKSTPSGSAMPMKAYCTELADLDRFLSIPYKPSRPDVSEYTAIRDRVGENGIVRVQPGHYFNSLAHLCDFEQLYVWLATERGRFEEVLDVFLGWMLDYVTYLCDEGLGPLYTPNGHELLVPPWASPELFRELLGPRDPKLYELIHRYGHLVRPHCHGCVRGVLKHFVEMGVDALEPIEPPPMGDVELPEARRIAGDGLCLCGNIPALELMTVEELDRRVRSACQTVGRRPGFILTTTGGLWTPSQPEIAGSHMIHMIRAAHRYGPCVCR